MSYWNTGDTITKTKLEGAYATGFRGASLRTHPDADLAASRVMLIAADEIVFDDSTRLSVTTSLVADVTVSGAGGLDTGSEAASTWYEIYAIAKDDNTKNLLLHRNKDWLKDTSFETASDVSRALRLATSTATDKLAQGFKLATSGLVPFIDAGLVRVAAVSAGTQIWFTIEADSAGSPSGTPLATSDKLDASALSTVAATYLRLPFRTPASLTSATQYHLVLQGNYTRSDTVNIFWTGVVAPGYANGSAKQFNGTTWSTATGVGDFQFKVFVERNLTSVTMPSGYTKKCRIGHVYNDGSSNFHPFIARDRVVKRPFANYLTAGAATAPTLLDLSSMVPPGPVLLSHGMLGTVINDSFRFGGVPDGYGSGVATPWGDVVTAATFTGDIQTFMPTIPVDFQGIYYTRVNGTGSIYLYALGFEW